MHDLVESSLKIVLRTIKILLCADNFGKPYSSFQKWYIFQLHWWAKFENNKPIIFSLSLSLTLNWIDVFSLTKLNSKRKLNNNSQPNNIHSIYRIQNSLPLKWTEPLESSTFKFLSCVFIPEEKLYSSCHLKCQSKHWIFHRVSHNELEHCTQNLFIYFQRDFHSQQIKMACRRFIANYCVSGNIKTARSLPVLSARNYSTDREDITKPTHTGQVRSRLKSCAFHQFFFLSIVPID